MGSNRLRRLGEAIGGVFRARVPEGSQGANTAGLAAFYQSQRRASLPLLESQGEERERDPEISPSPGPHKDAATIPG